MYCGQVLAISEGAMPWIMMVLATATIFYVVLRPMLRKKRDPLERPTGLTLSSQRSVEREMQNLLVELSQMARQITAQLDTRAARLEAMIEEADERIAQLKALSAASAAQPVRPAQPAPRLADPAPEMAPAAPRPANGEALDARYARIYTLAESGQSAQQIAAELDRPQGEIELILALRRR